MVRDEQLIALAEISYSVSDMMIRLGLIARGSNHSRYKKRAAKLGLVFAKRPPCIKPKRRSLEDYLALDGPHVQSSQLKKWLIAAGLLKDECKLCGLGPVWNGQPLTLQLDHENGNHDDCRFENLRILCPNCHTQTPTHGRLKQNSCAEIRQGDHGYVDYVKSRSGRKCECGTPIYKTNKTGKCRKCIYKIRRCKCGKRSSPHSKSGLCRVCFDVEHPRKRKVHDRPVLGILIEEIKSAGYSATGRKYGVSDNAVRKWIRHSQ